MSNLLIQRNRYKKQRWGNDLLGDHMFITDKKEILEHKKFGFQNNERLQLVNYPFNTDKIKKNFNKNKKRI